MVEIRIRPPLDNAALNALYAAAWPHHRTQDCLRGLDLCLSYVGAFAGADLVGFAKLAWDGDIHAFLLDPTVHPDWQRQGIGTRLVRQLLGVAHAARMEWVHVDCEADLFPFYAACGFSPTTAGLARVNPRSLFR